MLNNPGLFQTTIYPSKRDIDMINWPEVEKRQGESLESIYTRTQSSRQTGLEFKKGIGNKTGISDTSIRTELHKRGVKLLNRGGPRIKRSQQVIDRYFKIISLKGHETMRACDIYRQLGIQRWQFYHILNCYDINYLKRDKYVKRTPGTGTIN